MDQSGSALSDGKGPQAVLFPYSSSLLVGARAIKKAAAVPRLPPRFGSKHAFRSRAPEAFVSVRWPLFLIFPCGHPCAVSRRSLRSRQQDGTVSDCIPLAKGAFP